MSGHVVFVPDATGSNPVIRCNNCGWSWSISLPVSITMLCAISDSVQKDHANCAPRLVPQVEREPLKDDTGCDT